MTGKSTISPFSLSIETEMNWSTLTSRETPNYDCLLNLSDKDYRMINEIGHVGVIGGKQLERIYLKNCNAKARLKKHVLLRKLLRHEIIRKKNKIPVYTLGITGIHVANKDRNYANSWKTLSKKDVLQRLVFFQLYGRFVDEQKETDQLEVIPAEFPFVAAINRNGKHFHVLVVRGNENEINNFFRYEADKLPARILIVVEHLTHLNPIKDYIKPYVNRIRVTTDHDLKQPLQSMFYTFHQNEWIKEIELQTSIN